MFLNKDSLKALAMLTQVAITMIVPIGLGLFTGAFLDKKLETAPIFLILFILLGIGAGFRNIYHLTKKFIHSPSESNLNQERTLKQIKQEAEKKSQKGQGKDESQPH